MTEREVDQKIEALTNANEERIQLFFKSLSEKMPTIIAIIIAIWWLFYGTIKITSAELSIIERIGLTICTVVFAITYTSLIGNGGFESAKKTKRYEIAQLDWRDAVKKGNTYQKEISNYAKEIAKGNLYECRKNNLESVGIRYNEIFNADGESILTTEYLEKRKFTKGQKRMIKKCIKQNIVLPHIFGDLSGKYFGLKKEVTQAEFETKNIAMRTLVKTIICMVTVGFAFEFIGFSVGSVIYALFQIALWSGSGYMQRIKNYNFIMDVIIPQFDEKTLLITSFMGMSDVDKEKYKAQEEKIVALIENRKGVDKNG